MSEKSIRVFCVDDDPSTTSFYRFVLNPEPDIEFVGSLASTEGLVEAINKARPSILLMDLMIPGCDSLSTLDEIHSRFPSLTILIASGLENSDVVDEVFRRGATSFFLKTTDLLDIASVIRRAVAGERVIRRRSGSSPGGSDPDGGQLKIR